MGEMEDNSCHLCGEEVEDTDLLRLLHPITMIQQHHYNLGNSFNKLTNILDVVLMLLRSILRCLCFSSYKTTNKNIFKMKTVFRWRFICYN